MIYTWKFIHIDTGKYFNYLHLKFCVSEISFSMSNLTPTCSKGVALTQDTFGEIEIDGEVKTIKRFTWINRNKVSYNVNYYCNSQCGNYPN